MGNLFKDLAAGAFVYALAKGEELKYYEGSVVSVGSHSPAYAEELIEKLEAINYKNYLTKKEAEDIIMAMNPAPKWTMEQLKRMLAASGAQKEDAPCYNECALLTTISMVSSDSGETLAKYAQDEGQLMDMAYHLALDKLKDKDGKFDIRKYFDL